MNLVGTTAQLLFREVLLEAPNTGATTRGHAHAHADPVGQRVAVGYPVVQRLGQGQRDADGVRVGQFVGQERGPGQRGGQRGSGEGDGEPISSPDRSARQGVRHPVGLGERLGQREPVGQRVRHPVAGQQLRPVHRGGGQR